MIGVMNEPPDRVLLFLSDANCTRLEAVHDTNYQQYQMVVLRSEGLPAAAGVA